MAKLQKAWFFSSSKITPERCGLLNYYMHNLSKWNWQLDVTFKSLPTWIIFLFTHSSKRFVKKESKREVREASRESWVSICTMTLCSINHPAGQGATAVGRVFSVLSSNPTFSVVKTSNTFFGNFPNIFFAWSSLELRTVLIWICRHTQQNKGRHGTHPWPTKS